MRARMLASCCREGMGMRWSCTAKPRLRFTEAQRWTASLQVRSFCDRSRCRTYSLTRVRRVNWVSLTVMPAPMMQPSQHRTSSSLAGTASAANSRIVSSKRSLPPALTTSLTTRSSSIAAARSSPRFTGKIVPRPACGGSNSPETICAGSRDLAARICRSSAKVSVRATSPCSSSLSASRRLARQGPMKTIRRSAPYRWWRARAQATIGETIGARKGTSSGWYFSTKHTTAGQVVAM